MRSFRLDVGERRCLTWAGWVGLLLAMAATVAGSFLYGGTVLDVIVRAFSFVDQRLFDAFPEFRMVGRVIGTRIGGLILALGLVIAWGIGLALVRRTGIPLTVEIPDEAHDTDTAEGDWEWSSRRGS